jgi:putative nucleotidyltransferase with HDIG domain
MVLLWNPDADADDFAAVVEADPALTSAVLRAANSAASAPRAPLTNIHQAIVRVGLEAARHIVSTAVMRTQFSRFDESGLDGDDMWRHLLATAILSETMTGPGLPGQIAFGAALLHDIGRLAMAAQSAARYEQVVHAVRRGADAREAERRVFGTDHAAWGARICDAWHLPEEFADVAGGHHDVDADGLAGTVVQAREIAWRLGFGDGLAPAPADPFEGTDEEIAIVERVGGVAGLIAQLRWYRDATVSHSAPS